MRGTGTAASTSCGCMILLLLINLFIGTYCFAYTLNVTIGADVALGWDILGGVVGGEIVIPAAVICAIVKTTGADTPFWPLHKKETP